MACYQNLVHMCNAQSDHLALALARLGLLLPGSSLLPVQHSRQDLRQGEGGSVTFERRQAHLYERCARTYRIALKGPELSSFEGIENAVKTYRPTAT